MKYRANIDYKHKMIHYSNLGDKFFKVGGTLFIVLLVLCLLLKHSSFGTILINTSFLVLVIWLIILTYLEVQSKRYSVCPYCHKRIADRLTAYCHYENANNYVYFCSMQHFLYYYRFGVKDVKEK